jgi:glutaredoxin
LWLALLAAALLAAALLAACCAPAPTPLDAGSSARDAGRSAAVVYSYVDDQGRIKTVATPEQIPEPARGRVVATDTGKSREARSGDDRLLVLDLRDTQDGKPANYSVVDLGDQQRRAPAPEVSGGPGSLGDRLVQRGADRVAQWLGVRPPRPEVKVVLYVTPWCGYCKKAAAHLRAKGVLFEERDLERDAGAAGELAWKLRRAGVSDGGVPVLDIGGALVIGFEQKRIDELLARLSP